VLLVGLFLLASVLAEGANLDRERHFYLGRVSFAIGAFVVVEGLYLLGVMLSDGMLLEYLPPEMRGRFAGALTPEIGNLGGLIWHTKKFGYGLGHMRVWPETMDIGTTLTAMSGVLNIFVMSKAHFDARSPKVVSPSKSPAIQALLCWLVPGLGQWVQGRVQGRKKRGVIIFVLLVGLFLLASVLAEGANLDRERHFYYWSGQFLLGLPAVIVEFVHGHPRVASDIAYADAGVVIGCIAGMLNVLSMLDAFSYGEDELTGRAQPATPAQEAAA